MKNWREYKIEVNLDGTSAKYVDNVLIISFNGKENSKYLNYPFVDIVIGDGVIIIETKKFTKRQKKIIHTYRAHIRNLIKGVKEGFTYKLKLVYAKFPITIEMKGQEFIVKNLLGEKVPRRRIIPKEVKVDVKGGDITVMGQDKEKCGQVAALLEQLTRITHLDRRVIQDGIYITEKPHRKYS